MLLLPEELLDFEVEEFFLGSQLEHLLVEDCLLNDLHPSALLGYWQRLGGGLGGLWL